MLYGRENLKTLIYYVKKNLSAYELEFLMQTNGTLIDDDWIKFFKAEKIGVGVSFDGYTELHDKNRRTKNNEPIAEKILSNLQKMRSAGMGVGTLMVLNTAQEIDADKLFDFIKKYDLQPKISPVIACGRASNRKDTDEIYEAWIELMKKLLARLSEEENMQSVSLFDDIYSSILRGVPMRECSFNNCRYAGNFRPHQTSGSYAGTFEKGGHCFICDEYNRTKEIADAGKKIITVLNDKDGNMNNDDGKTELKNFKKSSEKLQQI